MPKLPSGCPQRICLEHRETNQDFPPHSRTQPEGLDSATWLNNPARTQCDRQAARDEDDHQAQIARSQETLIWKWMMKSLDHSRPGLPPCPITACVPDRRSSNASPQPRGNRRQSSGTVGNKTSKGRISDQALRDHEEAGGQFFAGQNSRRSGEHIPSEGGLRPKPTVLVANASPIRLAPLEGTQLFNRTSPRKSRPRKSILLERTGQFSSAYTDAIFARASSPGIATSVPG